jgi:tetratricopeptide (TPR) repeat protein
MPEHLTTEQQLILLAIFLGGLPIVSELGRFGIGLVGQRPAARLGLLVSLVAVGIGATRGTFMATNQAAIMMCVGWALVYVSVRSFPTPDRRLTKALLEMRNWQRNSYAHARVDESKERTLRAFPRAQRTVSDFKAAIEAFEDHKSAQRRLDAAVARIDLGFLYRMMGLRKDASREMDAGLTAVADLDATLPNEKVITALHLSQRLEQQADHNSCKSLERLKAMIDAYNKFGTGLSPVLRSEFHAEASLRKGIAELMATADFRRGELHHISGDHRAARNFYTRSIAISRGLEHSAAAEEATRIMKQLDVPPGDAGRSP